MTTNKRRRLLKAIAAGGGAVIAGRSLPETWSRPVVDSLALPAHAQTSPLSCLPASVSTTANQQDTQNDIYILFDGRSVCTVESLTDTLQTAPANAVIGIDADPSQYSWDRYDPGSDWTRTGTDSVADDNPPGTYYVEVTGAAGSFRVTFTVGFIGFEPVMTVSDVSINPA